MNRAAATLRVEGYDMSTTSPGEEKLIQGIREVVLEVTGPQFQSLERNLTTSFHSELQAVRDELNDRLNPMEVMLKKIVTHLGI